LRRREEKINTEINNEYRRNRIIKQSTIIKNDREERKRTREKRQIRKYGRTLKTVAMKRGPQYTVKLLLLFSVW
jgi:hypothetical protein